MRIGINANQLTVNEKSGIEFVVENFVQSFSSLTAEQGDELVLYVRQTPELSFPPHVQIRVLSWHFPVLWTQLRLGWELITNPPDAFIDFSNFLPFLSIFARTQRYFFTHDYGFIDFPQVYPWWQRLFLHIGNALSCAAAQAIFTPTEHTREQINTHFPQWYGKTYHVGLGIKESFLQLLRTPPPKPSRPEAAPQQPYLLFVGRIHVKKNIENLIRAFSAWNKTQDENYTLVLAGRDDGYRSYFEELLKTLSETHVRFAGFVSEQELAYLYLNARAVTLLSTGEGFGLPIVEGLAAGRPVLAATQTGGVTGALKDKIVLCNADAESIVKGLTQLEHASAPAPLLWETYTQVARKIYAIVKQNR